MSVQNGLPASLVCPLSVAGAWSAGVRAAVVCAGLPLVYGVQRCACWRVLRLWSAASRAVFVAWRSVQRVNSRAVVCVAVRLVCCVAGLAAVCCCRVLLCLLARPAARRGLSVHSVRRSWSYGLRCRYKRAALLLRLRCLFYTAANSARLIMSSALAASFKL